jgi:hypothetical protein
MNPGVFFSGVNTVNPCATYTLACLIGKIVAYLQIGIMLIISLAVIVFIWNVYKYFFKADLENKKEAGLYVMYSVIGFFVILSFWGLVAIVSNTLNLPNAQPAWPFGASGQINPPGQMIAPPPATGA